MQGQPDTEPVRNQLERLLNSETFATAGRHSRVLRYLVERTLAGEADQLKEYVLGTEVFDRPDSYDPRIDSIVRVEVRRLRNRLEDYYRGPGKDDQVVISIPRGSYVPVFSTRTSQPPIPEGAARPRPSFAVIAMGAVLAIALMLAALAVNAGRDTSAQASSVPGIAVLPVEHYSAEERDARLAAQITDAVTTELARVGTVSVASRTSAAQYAGTPRAMSEIASALNVSFALEASATSDGQRIRVSARLVDALRDRKVWVGEYDFTAAEIPSTSRRIAGDVAHATLTYVPR